MIAIDITQALCMMPIEICNTFRKGLVLVYTKVNDLRYGFNGIFDNQN